MNKILDGLIEYTKTHFANEEKLIKQHDYPNIAVHKAEHDETRKKMLNIQNLYSNGIEKVVCSMKALLYIWVDDHKKITDKKFCLYARSKCIT